MHSASIASFQAVGYEYAVEMTYPDLPEGTSGGLVNFTSQVAITIIVLYTRAIYNTELVGYQR